MRTQSYLNAKTISPVVATVLILVVAVVAVVGFQGWFQQYSSILQSEVEQEKINSVTIQNIIQDWVFIKSDSKTNVSSISLNHLKWDSVVLILLEQHS